MTEVPIFFEYVAIRFDLIEDEWQKIYSVDEVWWILTNGERPKLIRRKELAGLAQRDQEESWEGACVEFRVGPFAGQRGFYRSRGLVVMPVLGREVLVKVSPFEIFRVRG